MSRYSKSSYRSNPTGPRYSQGRAVSVLRSIESAIALYPASCGWRWPEWNVARMCAGRFGSRAAASKSIHAVERAAAADPLVDGLTLLLLLRVVEAPKVRPNRGGSRALFRIPVRAAGRSSLQSRKLFQREVLTAALFARFRPGRAYICRKDVVGHAQ